MKISVFVVSYNTSTLLKNCLSSIFKCKIPYEWEIFVVDNNSQDDSVEMVKNNFPKVILVENKINLGFAAANNQAFQKSAGEYILLLNPDAEVKQGTIENVIAFMVANPQCGICGGRLVNAQGQLEPSARRFPNWIYKLLTISGISTKYASSKLLGQADYKYFDHQAIMEVDWVPGTFTVLRRSMLEQIGFFDERFYLYYEETDLCLRAKRHGWKIYFYPFAEVMHIGGACSKTKKDLQQDLGGTQLLKFRMRSEFLYFRKNFGFFSMLANAFVEIGFHALRYLANYRDDQEHRIKRQYSQAIILHGLNALTDTCWGSKSPVVPW